MSSKSMSDFLKPRRNEAVARIRTNGMGLVAVLIITNLLPLPSPWTAFRVIWEGTSGYGGMGVPSWWWALCISELAVMSVLAFNFLQASYALKYPPAPLPPPSTPAKPKAVPVTPQANSVSQRRLAITPNGSPQLQKSFASSIYASSPISTPSRTLHYSMPFSSTSSRSLDTSFASSTGSPSPILNSPLAAYRGKHRTAVGRSFDGDLLSRLTQSVLDDDD